MEIKTARDKAKTYAEAYGMSKQRFAMEYGTDWEYDAVAALLADGAVNMWDDFTPAPPKPKKLIDWIKD